MNTRRCKYLQAPEGAIQYTYMSISLLNYLESNSFAYKELQKESIRCFCNLYMLGYSIAEWLTFIASDSALLELFYPSFALIHMQQQLHFQR